MSNIQLFEQAFAVDFPVEVAEMVLDRISGLYGTEFSKKYSGDSDAELIQRACTVLNGLTPADITRGIMRMNSEEFCPTLPRFRNWCEQGGDWWTADMAWAKSLNFMSDESAKITTLAKCALDEVKLIMSVEGQKAARKAFIDIYTDYLIKAKKQNRVQVMWVAPKSHKAIEEKPRNGVPCPPELAQKIKSLGRMS